MAIPFLKRNKKESKEKVDAQVKSEISDADKAFWGVLEGQHLTEKASSLQKGRVYTFAVAPWANKREITRAVEQKFDVSVESVNIVNIPRRRRRLGRSIGWKKSIKKAMVKVKEGQTIDWGQ